MHFIWLQTIQPLPGLVLPWNSNAEQYYNNSRQNKIAFHSPAKYNTDIGALTKVISHIFPPKTVGNAFHIWIYPMHAKWLAILCSPFYPPKNHRSWLLSIQTTAAGTHVPPFLSGKYNPISLCTSFCWLTVVEYILHPRNAIRNKLYPLDVLRYILQKFIYADVKSLSPISLKFPLEPWSPTDQWTLLR